MLPAFAKSCDSKWIKPAAGTASSVHLQMVTTEEAIVDAVPLLTYESLPSPGHTSNSGPEGNTPLIPEKPSEDGYNWRKYGQKNVKGNKYIRSYYRCSYHNCHVKKQVEHAHDGRITDTTYFGEHDHPKPQSSLPVTPQSVSSTKVQTTDDCPSDVAKPSSPHNSTTDKVEPKDVAEPAVGARITEESRHAFPASSGTNNDANQDDKLVLKRRRKGIDDAESVADKPGNQSCVVIETVSAVDIVNDGYRWRKYGQKLVKGNPNPRSYYRCTNPGCPAKKHVERAPHDPKVVVTTYDGKHEHDKPPVRTILPHSPKLNGAKKSNYSDEIHTAQNKATVHKQEEADTTDHLAKERKEPPTDTDHPAEEKNNAPTDRTNVAVSTHHSSAPMNEQQTPDKTGTSPCQESKPVKVEKPVS